MRYRVDTLLSGIGASLEAIGPRSLQISFLLGSLVPPFLLIETDRPGLYARILQEVAWFLHELYRLRWADPRRKQ